MKKESIISKEDFKKEIISAMEKRPKNWRKGQFVFNYIDENYGVARLVQFEKHIDCFYNDDNINDFIDASYDVLLIWYKLGV